MDWLRFLSGPPLKTPHKLRAFSPGKFLGILIGLPTAKHLRSHAEWPSNDAICWPVSTWNAGRMSVTHGFWWCFQCVCIVKCVLQLFVPSEKDTALKFKQLAIWKNGGLKFERWLSFWDKIIFRGELWNFQGVLLMAEVSTNKNQLLG